MPLHIATALSTAVQHSPKCPGTHAALTALQALLLTATASGLIKDGDTATAVGSLGSSIRQQLQQAGVLQPLAVIMTALAADLRTEAVAIAGLSNNELLWYLRHFMVTSDNVAKLVVWLARVLPRLMDLWGPVGQSDATKSSAYVLDTSGHAVASMQLCTAALQHISSVLQHVIPVAQQRASQQPAVLLAALQQQSARTADAMALGHDLVLAVYSAQHPASATICRQEQDSAAAALAAQVQQQQQLLLLSPNFMPCLASLLLLNISWINTASIVQDASSSSSSSQGRGGTSIDALTPCQLQLFERLSLAPQLAPVVGQLPGISSVTGRLVETCVRCIVAVDDLISTAPGPQAGVDKQRWQSEQQLWLLLLPVLLPYACKCLSWATSQEPSGQRVTQTYVKVLVDHCGRTLTVSDQLHSWLGGSSSDCHKQPHPAWMGEVLGGVLQLADQLLVLPQQQQQQHPGLGHHVQAPGESHRGSSTPTTASSGASTSSTSSTSVDGACRSDTWAECAGKLSQLLSLLVFESSSWFVHCDSTAGMPQAVRHHSSNRDVDASSSTGVAPSVPVVAKRFGEVCRVLEAGQRDMTAATQSGSIATSQAPNLRGMVDRCLHDLFIRGAKGGLAMYLGLHGPGASVVEQRQYYSMLGTIQKLSRCQTDGELCWGLALASTCCWAAALAAVRLLQGDVVTAGAQAAAQAPAPEHGQFTPPAAEQEPEVQYLPSLAIFGRCCLVWAEQLQQQAPDVLLLVSMTAAQHQQRQQGKVHVVYSAARVCIPWAAQDKAAATAPSCGLEELVATLSSWVGAIRSPAAHAALAAAAGGDLQQFRQQLEALSAAQHTVRQEGVTDASLAALVQQLQASGMMLSSIAVPHFCNNPACVNISGPTEVQLVSGRSCICAGCRTARYCGQGCQRQAWKQHRPVCKALAAAAAASHAHV